MAHLALPIDPLIPSLSPPLLNVQFGDEIIQTNQIRKYKKYHSVTIYNINRSNINESESSIIMKI